MRDTVPNCPRCESDNVAISNIEGYECIDCGCWFDVNEETGRVEWSYDHCPSEV